MVAILMLVKNDIFMIEFGSRFQLTQLIKHLGFLWKGETRINSL